MLARLHTVGRVEDDDVAAFGESPRGRETDAARRTGDEHDVAHGSLRRSRHEPAQC